MPALSPGHTLPPELMCVCNGNLRGRAITACSLDEKLIDGADYDLGAASSTLRSVFAHWGNFQMRYRPSTTALITSYNQKNLQSAWVTKTTQQMSCDLFPRGMWGSCRAWLIKAPALTAALLRDYGIQIPKDRTRGPSAT